MDDLLELLSDIMQYVMIEERLVESLRMKWEDAKCHEYIDSMASPGLEPKTL